MAGPRLVGATSAVILALCLGVLGLAGTGEDGLRAVIRLVMRVATRRRCSPLAAA